MISKCLIELHFMPCVEYMSKFLIYDQVIIERHENYQKRSYRNRALIPGPNDDIRLSVPLLKGKNEQMPITNVEIAYEEPWVTAMWQSIQSTYGNAPFFEHYAEALKALLMARPGHLFQLNTAVLHWLCEAIGLPFPELTAAYNRTVAKDTIDLRNTITPRNRGGSADFRPERYHQVFESERGFRSNMSSIDLLFAAGPSTIDYLASSLPEG